MVDKAESVRTRPMRLLCLGMSRTGTLSTREGLKKLGFKAYHMAVILHRKTAWQCAIWEEALQAKLEGNGKPFTRRDFDVLLGDYDAILDVPIIFFAEELIAAYPEAKVLLTTRDVDKWLDSMNGSIGRVARWKTWDTVAPYDQRIAGPWWMVASHCWLSACDRDFSRNGKGRAFFERHYKRMREILPEERKLEFHPSQGWDPLCKFLDVSKPEDGSEFPRINESESFMKFFTLIWYVAAFKFVAKTSSMVLIPALGVFLWYRRNNLPQIPFFNSK